MSGKNHGKHKNRRQRLAAHTELAKRVADVVSERRTPENTRELRSADAARLLASAAAALNALERAGIHPELSHGAVITGWGYVFRVNDKPTPWVARSRDIAPFPLAGASDDDE